MKTHRAIGFSVAAAALISQLHVSVGQLPECTSLPAESNGQWLVNPNSKADRTDRFIRPRTDEDVAALRDHLREIFFESKSLPTGTPVTVNLLPGTDMLENAPPELASISRAVIDMGMMKSDAFIYTPRRSNRQLVLYHAGHEGKIPPEFISELVSRGNTVVAMQMPLTGVNKKYAPSIEMPRIGLMKLVTHVQFAMVESPTFHPLRYFVEPVVLILNYMLRDHRFDSVAMIGFSGGGWTTTIAAALDTRISKSYEIAGTLPLHLRWDDWESWGDYEQVHPKLMNDVGYLELYVLDSVGRGRRHMQILNKYDGCCFAMPSVPAYVSVVEQRVASIEPGKYRFVLDDTHVGHKISRCTESRILADLSLPTR